MANGKEQQGDIAVSVCEGMPEKTLHHVVILILAGTVVCVEVDISLTKLMICKEVINVADHSVAPSPQYPALSAKSNPKHCILLRFEDVYGARLQGIGGLVQLLGIVNRVVHLDGFQIAGNA